MVLKDLKRGKSKRLAGSLGDVLWAAGWAQFYPQPHFYCLKHTAGEGLKRQEQQGKAWWVTVGGLSSQQETVPPSSDPTPPKCCSFAA